MHFLKKNKHLFDIKTYQKDMCHRDEKLQKKIVACAQKNGQWCFKCIPLIKRKFVTH